MYAYRNERIVLTNWFSYKNEIDTVLVILISGKSYQESADCIKNITTPFLLFFPGIDIKFWKCNKTEGVLNKIESF